MLIGRFTERPYQDPQSGYFGGTGRTIQDLSISNSDYDPGARLAALQPLPRRAGGDRRRSGFDAIMLNEHHSDRPSAWAVW